MNWRAIAAPFGADCTEACCRFGGSETSGARTTQRNQRVGGSRLSKHKTANGGLARDFVFQTKKGRDAAQVFLKKQGWYTYIGEDYGSKRLHCQALPKGTDPTAVLSNIPQLEI